MGKSDEKKLFEWALLHSNPENLKHEKIASKNTV